MIRFNNDYSESCHEEIFKYIFEHRDEQHAGYGADDYCNMAANLIRRKCECDSAAVHFLVGGTQSNLVMIAAALRPHQAVLAAQTGHINVHETGAIEATGHKVVALVSCDGKIKAQQVRSAVLEHMNHPDAEHIPQPKMVYISNPTEYGTLYSLDELTALSDVCKEFGLYLYLDGARLGYGLTAKGNDVKLSHIAALCDAFYIGGTKCGAMFGEAVVICNSVLAQDFRYLMKQRGGLLAKGWLLGMQFCALFDDDMYLKITANANILADRIRTCLNNLGYKIFIPNTTNQVFVVLPHSLLTKLEQNFVYSNWEKYDQENSVARFCTSWATKESDVTALCEELKRLTAKERCDRINGN